jgi:phospholipid/cholesterol/gamma-HCH transport system substrate-binding protein
MQISNETKIGALTIVAVTLLVLGYNFLKGKDLTKKSNVIYAKFTDVGALEISNPVKIKGFRIGNVYKIGNTDKKVTEVVVTINMQEDVLIPKNSVAIISSSLTGTSSINIMPGNSSDYIKEGDTLQSSNNPDLLGKVMNSLDPILISAKQTIDTLKRVLVSFNDILDPQAQANIKGIIANLESGTANLNGLLDNQNGALAKTLTNAEEFTRNLNQNNEKLNASIENFHQFSDKLSDVEIKTTVDELNNTITQVQTLLGKFNQNDGTIGLLLNDPKLYNNLEQTAYSLNILLDDLKTHPKRYVSFSLFGKKDKTTPLNSPLSDTTLKKK